MMAKVVAEAATGRQVASFVLGSVSTLIVVLLLQHRPEELSRPMPVQFLGWRNGTSSSPAATPSSEAAGPVITGGGETAGDRRYNVTKQQPNAAAGDLSLPSGAEDRQEEMVDDEADEFRGLAAAVERAASPEDQTVIITCVNHAWAAPGSLLDLFLESFRIGDGIAHLLDHVLIVAMDPPAMSRCETLHKHCYLYTMPGGMNFTSAKFFLSKEYLELVWSKLRLQRRVLQLGYHFLFTDVDIMWFRNPFKHVTAYADMTVSSDVFFGDPDNINNFPNTGFFHVRRNNRTLAMTKVWHETRSRFPGQNEQPVFNAIKKGLVRDLGLRVQYIDPAFMGGFCNYGKDLGKICTMHANCCVGLRAKLKDLRSVLDDWKRYTAMPHWARHAANWTVPGACIH
ncbi:hypothetical protein EJB05_57788 [Eragrostis curvula]|uniref:Nucleotide-diphospho-sugar transferase domain-containing protein n=1 Tax=Eragrostis curvula TaxID=38414 RepID=A0A5J9SD00_9POAL|nr:hypothetical protein EJB05_57788 [Eragrostis curvula]